MPDPKVGIAIGYVLVDGPLDAWNAHEADIALIPGYLGAGPGVRPTGAAGAATEP